MIVKMPEMKGYYRHKVAIKHQKQILGKSFQTWIYTNDIKKL